MTPAINLLERNGIAHCVHSYVHDSEADSYGEEAVAALGLASERVFKTLVVQLSNNEFAVGLVPVSSTLNLKTMASACKAKKASMALPSDVERVTGYVLGGVSPLGQRKSLTTVIDESSREFATVFISAGRRGLEIELAPTDLAQLCRARFAKIQHLPS